LILNVWISNVVRRFIFGWVVNVSIANVTGTVVSGLM
jgi:hypothetical protein